MKAIRIIAGVAVGLFLAGIVPAVLSLGPMVALFRSWTPVAMPDDAAMIANFHAKRETFDALVAMAGEDTRLTMIGPDWIEPPTLSEAGVSVARVARYRALFMEAGASQGLRRTGDTLRFIATSYGMVVHGASKAYVFTPTPRGKYDTNDAHDDLDTAAREARAAGERHFYGVHIIDAHWAIEMRED